MAYTFFSKNNVFLFIKVAIDYIKWNCYKKIHLRHDIYNTLYFKFVQFHAHLTGYHPFNWKRYFTFCFVR